jgi:hypothetical protein
VQVDPDVLTYYVFSRDYSFNGDTGQITYIELIAALSNTPLVEAQALSGKINLINTLTAPDKFPALYGGIEDDDGDLSFPIQTPDPNSELYGYLFVEDSLIHAAPPGIIRTLTTPPFVSTGDLDATGNIITNVAGPFPPPGPKVHDLVRILTGPNGPSSFVRVTGFTPNTVTVAVPFPVPLATGFSYEIAVSSYAVGGAATFPNPTTLNDPIATFLTTARVGYTVVITSGGNNGERRQILNIIDNFNLTLDVPLPGLGAGAYRIDDSLATYGGTPGDYMTALDGALLGQIALYADEQTYILDFLDQVFTDIFTSGTGQTTATSPILDDTNGTFLTSEVQSGHYVYIVAGANAGIYLVVNVNSETQLEVDSATPFPATLAGISYRVVRLFGASQETIVELFALYQSIAALLADTITFQAIVSTRIPVVVPPPPPPGPPPPPPPPWTFETDSFTRGTLTSDLDDRDVLVDARIAAIPTTVITVEDILANTDKLYDQRYAWIDTRINLQTGLIVQQATAVENRIQAQEDFFNQLIKLLAVEEG